MKDVEVTNPPDDSISCLRFSPPSVNNASYLIAGSWDNNVRCWEIQGNGQSIPKTQQSMQVRQMLHIPFSQKYSKLCQKSGCLSTLFRCVDIFNETVILEFQYYPLI